MPVVASLVKGTLGMSCLVDGKVPASIPVGQENSMVSDAATAEMCHIA